jgi:hypothetical protein
MVDNWSDSLALLREEPETTNTVEDALEGAEHDGRFNLPEAQDCPLCRINKTPYSSQENIYWKDKDGNYIVEAANQKKHPVRNMMVYSEHGYLPGESDLEAQEKDPFRRLFEITASQVYNSSKAYDNQLIQTIGMNSVPDHAHVMASNLEIEGDEPTDHQLTGSYIRWDLSDGQYSFKNPDEILIRDNIGRQALYPMYRESSGIKATDSNQYNVKSLREVSSGTD